MRLSLSCGCCTLLISIGAFADTNFQPAGVTNRGAVLVDENSVEFVASIKAGKPGFIQFGWIHHFATPTNGSKVVSLETNAIATCAGDRAYGETFYRDWVSQEGKARPNQIRFSPDLSNSGRVLLDDLLQPLSPVSAERIAVDHACWVLSGRKHGDAKPEFWKVPRDATRLTCKLRDGDLQMPIAFHESTGRVYAFNRLVVGAAISPSRIEFSDALEGAEYRLVIDRYSGEAAFFDREHGRFAWSCAKAEQRF